MDSISRLTGALAFVFAGFLAPSAHSQFQVIFTEDFEDGLTGWTIENVVDPPPTPLWHLAEPGECGVTVTRMAAYSKPEPGCGYDAPSIFQSATALVSEPFLLTGSAPFHLSLDAHFSMQGPLADFQVYLYNPALQQNGEFGAIESQLKAQPDTLVHAEGDFSPPPTWNIADPVQVRFVAGSNVVSGPGTGLRVDNIELRSSAFDQLDGSLPGSGPINPILVGSGPLTSGSQNSVLLKWVPQGVPAYLITGFAVLNAPFKGGVMVPFPALITPVTTGGGMQAITIVPFTLPTVPPAFRFYMQYWIQDPGAVHGLSASNGLRGTTS